MVTFKRLDFEGVPSGPGIVTVLFVRKFFMLLNIPIPGCISKRFWSMDYCTTLSKAFVMSTPTTVLNC